MQIVKKDLGVKITEVSFDNKVKFVVGEEYFDYDGMTCTEILEVAEADREENEVVEVFFKDGSDGMVAYFDKDGEEVWI